MKRYVLLAMSLTIGFMSVSSCAPVRTVTVIQTVTVTPVSTPAPLSPSPIKPTTTAPATSKLPPTSESPIASQTPRITSTSSSLVFAYDNHHSTTSGTNGLTKLIRGKGWEVIELDIEPITYDALRSKGVSVLFTGCEILPYTDTELSELKRFVDNGGHVLVPSSGAYRQAEREITKIFGIDITPDTIGGNSVQISINSTHPLLQDVKTLGFLYPQYLTVQSPAVVLLSGGKTEPYLPLIAYYQSLTGGKVIVFPDNLYFEYSNKSSLNLADNQLFFINVLRWLKP
jgi:hypothetical protein